MTGNTPEPKTRDVSLTPTPESPSSEVEKPQLEDATSMVTPCTNDSDPGLTSATVVLDSDYEKQKEKPMMVVPVRQFPGVTVDLKLQDPQNDDSAQTPSDKQPEDKTKRGKKKKEKKLKKGYRATDFADWKYYIQVGCSIFHVHFKPDASHHLYLVLQPWTMTQLLRDFGDANKIDDIGMIPRYLGLGCFPSHTAYQQVIAGYYNTYRPLQWIPTEGEWLTIEKMLKHIFRNQYELGLDYLQILYLQPMQMLPILVLVSRERSTGKTTFLNFLKEIFGANAAFVTNENLRSKFNSERASCLLHMCDEAFQNKKEDSERIKAFSTARKTHLEYKGKDRYEIDNFAKIILCSNNVNDPVYIDPEEVRYWVIEVPKLAKDNPSILEAMKSEIPAFLHYLLHRQLSVPQALSRMWFEPAQLRTRALTRIIRKCRPSVELDLAEFLLDAMDHFGVDHLEMTNTELQNLLRGQGRDIRDAHRIVCKVWDVPRANNKLAYDLFADWNTRTSIRAYGRFYSFTRAFLLTVVPDYVSPIETEPVKEKPDNSLYNSD